MFSMYTKIPTSYWRNEGDYIADCINHYSECYFKDIYKTSSLILSLASRCTPHDKQVIFLPLAVVSQIDFICISFILEHCS